KVKHACNCAFLKPELNNAGELGRNTPFIIAVKSFSSNLVSPFPINSAVRLNTFSGDSPFLQYR
ncbi:MAG TPA: hypothetical protein PKI46_01790, partial [Bacteroidales bacterium]|nr:hypothetical protein [Bacteroidales bacterium]